MTRIDRYFSCRTRSVTTGMKPGIGISIYAVSPRNYEKPIKPTDYMGYKTYTLTTEKQSIKDPPKRVLDKDLGV